MAKVRTLIGVDSTLPARLSVSDIARICQIPRGALHAGRPVLPPPDGRDGLAGRTWYWPATAQAWIGTLPRCAECGARPPRSLRRHKARAHRT
ncbi:hypothetical protein BN13_590003 [Nostocoides jenkinsii Ben 74]|uniref:Uncharacterized protein n=1 Tax=Nostocoides jenkinsii Ben 74 TaxID=1193518 RepID=A0A077MFN1_9MICO|nr:hypothetical protein BN13_590003 [Tetrasphaera jenkinsii Ben 74]